VHLFQDDVRDSFSGDVGSKVVKNALAVNPNITTYRLSARSEGGLVAWYN